jgi:hypothetical protein
MTPETLDRLTIDLIFALRDSLTDLSPIDFWSGRLKTALDTAAAGSSRAGEALTTAARKLQIDIITAKPAPVAVATCAAIDADYPAWASHISRNSTYIVALAYAERDLHSRARKDPSNDQQPTF